MATGLLHVKVWTDNVSSFRFERDALKSLDEYSDEEADYRDDENADCLSSFDDNNYEEQNFLNWEKELSQSLQEEHAGNLDLAQLFVLIVQKKDRLQRYIIHVIPRVFT